MNALTTQEALNQFLEGIKLDAESLDGFIHRFQEDQYLDYKDGEITAKTNKERAKKTIRSYVCGFANSEGGILIVGVTDQEPHEVSPCSPVGNESIDRWAEDLLRDIAPRLSPPPRIYVVDHKKGPVLVIAVARAGELVPCVEAGQLKFFLRIGESTIEAPPYLISDLVLGRRQRPNIDLTATPEQPPPFERAKTIGVTIRFLAENVGMVTAEQLALGVATWIVGPKVDSINEHLLSYIDIGETPVNDAYWSLRHYTAKPRYPEVTRLPAFERILFESIVGVPLPFTEVPTEIVAAVYLLSKGSPPLWFEFSFRCHRSSEGTVETSRGVISDCKTCRILTGRPRVVCSFMD
jgi:hypothetical protein